MAPRKFNIRGLFIVIAFVAWTLGWRVDRRQLENQIEAADVEIATRGRAIVAAMTFTSVHKSRKRDASSEIR